MQFDDEQKPDSDPYERLKNLPRAISKEESEANMDRTVLAMQESIRKGIEAKKKN